MGMGFFDTVFPVMFGLVFVVVLAIFVMTFVRSIGQWHRNNQSPRLTVEATVVDKRSQMHHSGNDDHMTSTTYYVTFQVTSGDRMELEVPSTEVGYLIVGDRGRLTFQGTRFLHFERL